MPRARPLHRARGTEGSRARKRARRARDAVDAALPAAAHVKRAPARSRPSATVCLVRELSAMCPGRQQAGPCHALTPVFSRRAITGSGELPERPGDQPDRLRGHRLEQTVARIRPGSACRPSAKTPRRPRGSRAIPEGAIDRTLLLGIRAPVIPRMVQERSGSPPAWSPAWRAAAPLSRAGVTSNAAVAPCTKLGPLRASLSQVSAGPSSPGRSTTGQRLLDSGSMRCILLRLDQLV